MSVQKLLVGGPKGVVAQDQLPRSPTGTVLNRETHSAFPDFLPFSCPANFCPLTRIPGASPTASSSNSWMPLLHSSGPRPMRALTLLASRIAQQSHDQWLPGYPKPEPVRRQHPPHSPTDPRLFTTDSSFQAQNASDTRFAASSDRARAIVRNVSAAASNAW